VKAGEANSLDKYLAHVAKQTDNGCRYRRSTKGRRFKSRRPD